MRKKSILLLVLTISMKLFSQETNIQKKMDSILNEADRLYRHEKTVWNSTDLLMRNKKLKKNYGGYIVSELGDTTLVTYLDKSQKKSLIRYRYLNNNPEKPISTAFENTALSRQEKELLDIKVGILGKLSDTKYGVTIPDGYEPNFVLLKDADTFRLYIIMGSSKAGIVPFGNDYLFESDASGAITGWKKFHSRMIPVYCNWPEEKKVVSAIHSHLKTTPYITATDICTFRLYGAFCGLEEFMIYSTATGKYYKYDIKTNTIEITDR